MNLTKAHVRYLEAELIRLAKSIGRVNLINSADPTGGAALPEADESDMQYFIKQIQILLPVLGFDILRGRPAPTPGTTTAASVTVSTPDSTPEEKPTESVDSPLFILRSRDGVQAQARVIDGEFTVLAGSIINNTMKVKAESNAATMKAFATRKAEHAKIIERADPGPHPHLSSMTKDRPFTSPSAAAATCLARATANGRTEWRTEHGQTYGSWEQ